MADGLKAIVAAEVKAIKDTGMEADFNPLREIGLARDAKRRERKHQALTKSDDFYKEKEAAYAQMATNVEANYFQVYHQYANAGYSAAECKKHALASAHTTKQLGEKAIESEFGSDNTTLHNLQLANKMAVQATGVKIN